MRPRDVGYPGTTVNKCFLHVIRALRKRWLSKYGRSVCEVC